MDIRKQQAAASSGQPEAEDSAAALQLLGVAKTLLANVSALLPIILGAQTWQRQLPRMQMLHCTPQGVLKAWRWLNSALVSIVQPRIAGIEMGERWSGDPSRVFGRLAIPYIYALGLSIGGCL